MCPFSPLAPLVSVLHEVFLSTVTLHQHHHNSLCPLSLSTSFYVFLYPSHLLSPPLPHTYALTLGMPEPVEVLIGAVGVPGLLRAALNRSVLR